MNLYALPIKVGRGNADEMPEEMLGAYVIAYSSADDHLRALERAVAILRSRGYEFQDVQGEVQQLDPSMWAQHVQSTWPDHVDHLPAQDQIEEIVEGGGVFFSPFAGYEKE